MKRLILFSTLAVVIAAAGFGGGWLAATTRPVPTQPQAELPAPSAAEASLKAHALWGMTLGSKRVYVSDNETETTTVEAIRVEKSRIVYSLKTIDSRGDIRVEDVYRNEEGIWYQQGEIDDPHEKELRLLLPCNKGDRWRIVTASPLDTQYVCEGTERITVPAGTFDTVKFTLEIVVPTGVWIDTYWYSMEHGLIQHRIWRPSVNFGPPIRDSLFKLVSMQ